MSVYGYLPMMISAQCIRKTTLGCSGKPEIMWLKDRKEMRFPVVNQCRFCYNTIYNSAPLSLLGLSASVKGLGPKALRLNFTVEEPAAADPGRVFRGVRSGRKGSRTVCFEKSVYARTF